MVGLLVRKSVLSLLALFFVMSLYVTHGDTQTTTVVGIQADASEPPAPRCPGAQGYVVESTLDLPVGNNGGRILRYDPLGDRVYTMQFGASPTSVCVATASTPLTLIGCTPFTNPGEVFVLNQPANAVVNSDGEFIYYHRKAPATCVNPAFQCLGSRVFQGASQVLDVDYTGFGIQQLDAVVIDRDTDQAWLHYVDIVASNRQLGIINADTKTVITQLFGITPSTGFGGFIALDDANVYGYNATVAWRTPRAASAFTTTALGCLGGRTPDDIVVTRDDTGGSINIATSGGSPDIMCGIPKGTFVQNLTTSFVAADGDETGEMTAFYDRGNNVIHTFRANPATNILRRVQLSGFQNITGTILDFLAGSCCSIYIDRHTVMDFSPENLALYIVSTTSPARITKIRVCA